MTRTGSLARNVLSNWLGIPINLAYGLIITPVIVRALDTELYGVWSFLNGLLMYSNLLYVGLGSALIRHVAQHNETGDQPGMNRLFSVVTGIYGVIGIVCCAVMIALSGLVPYTFAEPLSAEAARSAAITCVLLGVQLFFVFVGSAFSGLICGFNRYDIVNISGIAAVVLRFVATPLVLQPGNDPLIRLAALTAATTVLQTLMLVVIGYRLVPGLSFRLVRWRLDELRVLYGFGVPSFFILFAIRLVSFCDTTIIGIMLGASSVAIYSFPLQLMEYARRTVAGFTNVLLPGLTAITTRGDMPALREAYLSATRIAWFLTAWPAATLMAVGPAFLNRWVGDAFGAPAEWVLVFLAIAAFGQVLSTQAPLGFYQAMHLVKFPAQVLMLEALLNLAMSIWLAPTMGLTGVALATAIPAVFVSGIVLPAYLCQKMALPIRTFLVASVLPGGLMFVATSAMLYISGLVIMAESYPALLLRGSITIPVALLVFLGTFPAHERQALWQLQAKLLRMVPRFG